MLKRNLELRENAACGENSLPTSSHVIYCRYSDNDFRHYCFINHIIVVCVHE